MKFYIVYLAAISSLLFSSITHGKVGLHILEDKSSASELVIFVHGLDGNSKDTWKNGNGFNFAKSFSTDKDLKNYDVATFDYPSRCDNVTPLEASNNLSEEIRTLTKKYKKFHFIAHSLGGIVTRQLLVTNPNFPAGTIQLLATPNLGSSMVMLANTYCALQFKRRITELGSERGSIIDTINDNWRNVFEQNDGTKKFSFYAAFEIPQGASLTVVAKDSALLFSSRTFYFTVGHQGIVKPESPNDLIYIWAKKNLLNAKGPAQTKIDQSNKYEDLRFNQVNKMIVELDKKIGKTFSNNVTKLINERSLSEANQMISAKREVLKNQFYLYTGLIFDLSNNYSEALKNYSQYAAKNSATNYGDELTMGSVQRFYEINGFRDRDPRRLDDLELDSDTARKVKTLMKAEMIK